MSECSLTPRHDRSATNRSRRVLGSIDGHSRSFHTHSDTHQQTAGKLLSPCLAKSRANDGPDAEVSREEDDTTTTKDIIDRIRQPATNETSAKVLDKFDHLGCVLR